jgi:hypothetical protein
MVCERDADGAATCAEAMMPFVVVVVVAVDLPVDQV